MDNENKHTESYTLGSGHLRVEASTNEKIPTAEAELIEFVNKFIKEHSVLGRIKGGASLDYTTEKTEDQDDLGYCKISTIKTENVDLKSGIMTWDGYALEKLCATARVLKDKDTGAVTVKIGGLGNQKDTTYIVCFEHYSHLLRVVIIGKNTNGFSLTFDQDKATVIDFVFHAEALDNDGTLVIIQDFRNATAEAKAELLKSIAPSTSEQTPSEGGNGNGTNGTGGDLDDEP